MNEQQGRLLVNLSFVGKKPTGLATYALNLLPELALENPVALTPTGQTLGDGICAHPIPANLTPEQGKLGHFRRLVWTQMQVPRLYRQWRSPLLFSPIPEAPLGTGCRFVVTMHDLIPLRFPSWRSPLTHYFRHYVPLVLQQAQHILCNSESTAKDVHERFQIPAHKLTPIPLGYDAQHFRWLDLPSESPQGDRYFLYIGRLDPYKNLQRLIQAFANARLVDQQLWIAGSADPRFTPILKSQVEELGIAHQVKFLDYVPYQDLPELINRAIALVFPSLWEGFGLPVLEAMACGTPVITSNLSALPEVAADAALLIDPYQVDSLTDALRQMAMDGELRSQLRSAGLARAQQFSWAKTGAKTRDVLRNYLK